MSAYKPYPKTKDSGVEWLGNVPEHWIKKAIKWESNVARGASPRPIDDPIYFDDEGEYAWVRIADVTSAGRFLDSTIQRLSSLGSSLSVRLQPGDLFLSIAGSVGKPCVTTMKCCIHDGFVYFPSWKSSIDFLYYIFASGEPYKGLGKFGTQLNLNTDTVGGIQIALPTYADQLQIAAFLDRECGKLDALQAKQERLIELLKEKRQALISHAVTRGLDPAAKLKPSGIEWLGDVPEHWEVTRMKFHVSRFEQGWSPQCEGRNKEDGEVGVLKVGCVNGGAFRVEEHKVLPPQLEPRYQYSLKRGDLLISRANTRELVGSAAVVDRDHDDILLCDKLYRLRFYQGVSEIYLSHFLGTSEVRQQIELDATGASASMVNIGQDCIRELNIALPPLEEQLAIVAHLDKKCGKIDQLKAKAERAIELLKERRSALISAAVTGKIDVRDFNETS